MAPSSGLPERVAQTRGKVFVKIAGSIPGYFVIKCKNYPLFYESFTLPLGTPRGLFRGNFALGGADMLPENLLHTLLIVCPLVFLGGLVDAVAGGGGLITLPAYLLAGLPPTPPLPLTSAAMCGAPCWPPSGF